MPAVLGEVHYPQHASCNCCDVCGCIEQSYMYELQDPDALFVAYQLLMPQFIGDRGLKLRHTNMRQFIASALVCKSGSSMSGFKDVRGQNMIFPGE
jgi:hypothetical protein